MITFFLFPGENGDFGYTAPTSTQSVASATDLLDDRSNSFEDSASYPGGASGMDPAQQAFNAYNPQSYPAPAPAGYSAPAPDLKLVQEQSNQQVQVQGMIVDCKH